MAIPLHVHSENSALDGWSKITEIADRIEKIGCPCCGLTDHGVVTGHLELDKVFRKRGIKPIFGCEMYQGTKTTFKGQERDQAHLIVLAETDEGLRNLWRLIDSTAREDHFRHVGRVFKDDLIRHKSGLILTSACALGLVAKEAVQGEYDWLNWYLDNFGDNFYIELSTYPADKGFEDEGEDPLNTRIINEALVEVGLERGAQFVYGDDSHYADPDQFKLHNAYLAVKTRQSIDTPVEERKMYHPPGALAIKTEEQVREALSYLPEAVVDNAIDNSIAIAERCNASLPGVERRLPVFVPSDCPWLEKYDIDSDDAAQVFIELVEQGVVRRYGEDASEEVWDRAIMEMEVFLSSGLEHYFLVAWDVGEFCDDPGHWWDLVGEEGDPEIIDRGPGRGSAAGCLVAYALGITDADPLHYDLYFERFWNPGRAKGFPDIDSDFAKRRRKDVYTYLQKRWGEDRVRHIGTVTRMKPKAAIDRMWIGCGVTFSEKEQLKKIVEETPDIEILGPDQIGWSREIEPGKVYYVEEEVGEEIEKWIKSQAKPRQPILDRFVWILKNVCNRAENYGIHASGIIVSPVDLPDVTPCYLRGPKEDRVPATLFPMDEVEKLMLVKLDVLGLKTLDTLADWTKQMSEVHGIDIDWSSIDKEEHPEEMWQLLDDGYSAGIFQIEGGFAAKLAKEFRPRSIEDLSIIVALNRPGPIRSGAPESFIKRRRGETDTKFDGRKIPILKPILEPTYGWFLYQEQVITYFNALGYTLSESDAVRKILGKKQPEKWLDLFHGRDEWKGKGYIERAAAAGLGNIRGTKAEEWNGEDVSGKNEFAKGVKLDAWVIWKMIVDFGKYSFNKSHSVAYGIIGFRTLFAKFYGPSEFYMACIRTVPKDKKAKLIPMYVNEARRMAIKVLPPDIRYSQADISVHDGDVIFGFSNIKGVSSSGPYMVYLRDELKFDVSTPEKLYEQLLELNDQFLADKKQATKNGNPWPKTKKSPKQQLQENKIEAMFTAGCWDDLGQRDIPLRVKQECEKQLLEVILTDNSVEAFANNWEEIENCDPYEWAQEPWNGEDQYFTLPGIISAIKETRSKAKKELMGIVTIEFEGEEVEFVVFPSQWSKYKFLFKERAVGIFKVKRTSRGVNFENGHLLK